MDSAISNLVNQLNAVSSRLDQVEKQLATGSVSSSSSSSSSQSSGNSGADSPSVAGYQNLVSQFIPNFIKLTEQIGDSVLTEQAKLFEQAVNAQTAMLQVAASSKKPSDAVLQNIIKPTSDAMGKITTLRDANRSSKVFNHLSTISEGVPALGWVLVTPTPGPHIADMRGGSEFYSNRILKDFKGKEQVHVDWVNAFNGFLKELQPYVKQYHTTGLVWNPNGGDASSASTSTPTATATTSTPTPKPVATTPTPNANAQTNLFSALSKGTDISKGLKKVTDDMKTKNRSEEEKTSVVKAKEPTPVKTTATKASTAPVKPPKLALEGAKWCVEYQLNNKNIVIEETEAKQTCYIYKCVGSTIVIKGKINAVVIDDCKKTAVVFETLVASCDIVNCNSVEVQVTGKVPAISIDKTQGLQLYMSKDSLDSEIYSSKSDQMNILIPGADANADLVELAVPEQYVTKIRGGKLVTECSSHV